MSESNGVRNLRAMFEKGNSPPSDVARGRSPAGESVTSNGSSRPVSKVRASFVAVERSGQMGTQLGLKKVSSGEEQPVNGRAVLSPTESGHFENLKRLPSQREENPELSLKAGSTLNTADTAQNEQVGKKTEPNGHTQQQDPLNPTADVPSSAQSSPSKLGKKENQKPQSPFPSSPSKTTAGKLEEAATREPKQEAAAVADPTSPAKALRVSKPSQPKVNQGSTPSNKAPPSTTASKNVEKVSAAKPHTSNPASKKVDKTLPTSKPAPISTKNNPQDSRKTDSINPPVSVPKTPSTEEHARPPKTMTPKRTPGRTNETREAAKTSSRKPSTASLKSAAAAPKPRAPPSTTSHASAAKTSPTMKPRPKSPTRPVRLPASATAPTAASAAKTAKSEGTSRSPSRATAAPHQTTKANRPRAAALRKSSSRFSLPNQNPPKTSTERPKSRVSSGAVTKPPDDGFLARMMRPTASSNSKVHEKHEAKAVPPPRRNVVEKRDRRSAGSESVKSHATQSEKVEEAPEVPQIPKETERKRLSTEATAVDEEPVVERAYPKQTEVDLPAEISDLEMEKKAEPLLPQFRA
ncbi:MAG: hypothetical protein M1824_001401 [Vezdaea acicularis]|nr:MAG: hypothetical protein M1824_001401 [Vezdaea acicularis]